MSSKTACITDFIVVRLPRLSLTKLTALPLIESSLQDYLASWLASPGVLEAIYLASPSLLERIELWRSNPDSKSGRKVTLALLKYLSRMSSRPTPFGLFAGVALGKLESTTQFKPANLQQDGRNTRLDMHYLSTIQQQWAKSDEGRQALRYLPNSTLYPLGRVLHYIEFYQSALQRQYRLSSVEQDEALQTILLLAEQVLTVSALVEQFIAIFPETEKSEVKHYIEQLIKEQILVAELKLPLTSGQPDHAFATQLRQAGNLNDSKQLMTVLDGLAAMDQQRDVKPEDYKSIVQVLKQLSYPVSENKLFQADLWRAMQVCQLDSVLLADLEQTLLVLKSQDHAAENPFQAFIKSFQQRFEGQFVPLLQLLDEEAGIPFSNETGYETPLLAGLNIANRQRGSASQPLNAMEQHVLKALQQQANSSCVQLSRDELMKHMNTAALWRQLPASLALKFSCYLDEKQRPLLHWQGCSGPSGGNLLGRFCHLDTGLQQKVQDYLAAEQALSPDVVFAEVVHMPDGRPGNVIARPNLRQYEIVFLADSVLPSEQQIPVQDLYVFVEVGLVKLWSRRLNKQVMPRLTSAHNYSARSLSVYRFLCMLQHQHRRLPNFKAPASFMQMERQPRVQLDNVILQEAQWRVERSMLEALVIAESWQPDAWQALEQRYQLPRYVCYAVSDNVLTIDLYNPIMVAVLLGETAEQPTILLKESLAMQYQSVVSNEDGDYAHEIILPVLNPQAEPFVTLHPDPAKQLDVSIARCFAPGSEWISIKIYAAQSTAELVLMDVVAPLLQQAQRQGLFQQWFFIRYGDPGWHLRLRLLGAPAILHGKLLPMLQQQLQHWLESGRVHKMELFTYQREVERYGGNLAIVLAEQVFQFDSELVLNTMQLLRQHGESVRWRMALLGVDAMLSAFGYKVQSKLGLISQLRQSFGQEFQENAQLRNQLGKKYREFQVQLQADFRAIDSQTYEQPLQQMLAVRQQFLLQIQPVAQQILNLQQQEQLSCSLDTLLHSLLHMFNNRIFKTYGREQEFVVYDFLRRFYLSCQTQHTTERV